MDGRTLVRCGWCSLLASIAIGCSPGRDFLHQDPPVSTVDWGKSYPSATDNGAMDRYQNAAANSYPESDATQAGGTGGPATGMPQQAQSAPPAQLSAPNPLPGMQSAPPGSAPGNGQAAPQANPGNNSSNAAQNCPQGCQPGQAQKPVNGQANGNAVPGQPGFVYGLPPGYVYTTPPGDPHLRATPTAVGGRLELAPWEIPADRVVELSRQIEGLNLLNATMAARIRDLEAQGATREQALGEAVRDAERVEEEAARMRGNLQLSRDELAVLRARYMALEREDIALFEKFIVVLRNQFQVPAIERVP